MIKSTIIIKNQFLQTVCLNSKMSSFILLLLCSVTFCAQSSGPWTDRKEKELSFNEDNVCTVRQGFLASRKEVSHSNLFSFK